MKQLIAHHKKQHTQRVAKHKVNHSKNVINVKQKHRGMVLRHIACGVAGAGIIGGLTAISLPALVPVMTFAGGSAGIMLSQSGMSNNHKSHTGNLKRGKRK